jgi:DNA-binding XRE family transcriptional regulator
MLERMKKLHIELKFIGPPENRDEAITALKNLGFREIPDTVPWENLFPEYSEDTLPGVILAGSRIKEGLTQKQLSEITGISRRYISEMENGKRPIDKKMAKILGQVLHVGYKVFLR